MPADSSRRWRSGLRWLSVPGGLAGLAASIVSASLGPTLLVTCFALIFLAVFYGAWAVLVPGSQAGPRGLLRLAGNGLAWFWTAIGVIHLIAWSLWTLLGLALILVALAIRADRSRKARRRAHPYRPPAWQVVEMLAWPDAYRSLAVHRASDEELCRLWRITGEKLRTARLPSTLEWIAELRQLALDELAERDPDGFARWLSDQPQTNDPEAYLRR